MKCRADPVLEKISPSSIVHINVKTALKNLPIELKLAANSTVSYLKSAIRDAEGIPEDQQELTALIAGDLKSKMDDGKLIQDYFPKYDAKNKKWVLNVSLSLHLP